MTKNELMTENTILANNYNILHDALDKMNSTINELHNKLDAQDKIINEQALEIARLKEENKHIAQWWKETNVIIRNDKSLAINDNAMKYILDLEEEIARLKETLKGTTHCFDEVEHRELQEAKDNLQKDYQEAVDKINELKEDKKEAVKYINRTQMPEGYKKVLLGILGDKANE